ncbi:MAG: hypothetical protein HGA33_03345 [Candidatus Moranbacteria bacterium]|nr:hypothetical protein [Candidatus Moranbacteria bacterium]
MKTSNPLRALAITRLSRFDQLPLGAFPVFFVETSATAHLLYLEIGDGRTLVAVIKRDGLREPRTMPGQVEIIRSDAGALVKPFVDDKTGDDFLINSPLWFNLIPKVSDEAEAIILDPHGRYLIDDAIMKQGRGYLIIQFGDGYSKQAFKEFNSMETLGFPFERIIEFPTEFELAFTPEADSYVDAIICLFPQ